MGLLPDNIIAEIDMKSYIFDDDHILVIIDNDIVTLIMSSYVGKLNTTRATVNNCIVTGLVCGIFRLPRARAVG